MILVVGAGGVVGRHVTLALLAGGSAVRALVRNPAAHEALAAAGAEVVAGDLRDPASLRAACAGAEAVFTTAHSFLGRGAAAPRYVDGLGNRNLVDAARAQSVRRFVFTSARSPAEFERVDFFRCKNRAEAYLAASGLAYTILRPTVFMDSWVPLFAAPLLAEGAVSIVGTGTNPVNFVAAADVAGLAVRLIPDQDADHVVECGGPADLTLLEVLELLQRITGRTARVRHLPLLPLRLRAAVQRPFDPVAARLTQTAVLMASTDQTFDAGATLARYPMQLTTMAEWITRHYG